MAKTRGPAALKYTVWQHKIPRGKLRYAGGAGLLCGSKQIAFQYVCNPCRRCATYAT